MVLPLWLSFYDYGGGRSGGIGKIAKSELARKFDAKEGDGAMDVVESDSGDDHAGVGENFEVFWRVLYRSLFCYRKNIFSSPSIAFLY